LKLRTNTTPRQVSFATEFIRDCTAGISLFTVVCIIM